MSASKYLAKGSWNMQFSLGKNTCMKELHSDALKTNAPWKTELCVRWCITSVQKKSTNLIQLFGWVWKLDYITFWTALNISSAVRKKKVFSKLPSPQLWVLTEDCSDLCISNRLRASISDLCFSFEISAISNLPILTHWAECFMSQKWQNWPIVLNTAAEQSKM